MRAGLALLIGFITVSSAVAQTARHPTPADRSPPPRGNALSPKSTAGTNPCASYGQGFVKIEGTDSCVKIGGALDVGVAASSRR